MPHQPCALNRLEFLPATAQTVALYLTDLARTHKVSTLYRRLSGISQAHQAAGRATLTTDAQVRAMVETLSSTSLLGARDRALLLVGPPFGSNPLTRPVRAWLDGAAIAGGPIFRPVDRHSNVADTGLTDQSVALIVKRCAKAAGLDREKHAGHSLRSGLATAAAMADVSERAIMAQTATSPCQMVRRSIRDGLCSEATPPRPMVCERMNPRGARPVYVSARRRSARVTASRSWSCSANSRSEPAPTADPLGPVRAGPGRESSPVEPPD